MEVAVTVRRIDHIGILVRSIDEALAYYVSTLGLRLVGDEVRADGVVRLAYLVAGDTTVQLVEPLVNGELADALVDRGEGLHHICFEVGNLAEALTELPGESDRPIERGGRGRNVAFLGHRPNNALIELAE
jgi:methylmalonyl-CoA epimerase